MRACLAARAQAATLSPRRRRSCSTQRLFGSLRFAVVQNESLARRLSDDELLRGFQGTPLPLKENSVAGYVARAAEYNKERS